MDSLYSSISSPLNQETIQNDAVKKIIASQNRINEFSDLYVSPSTRELLEQNAILCPQYSANLHDHPAHKLIEIDLLHNHAAHLIKEPTTVMFMKKKPKFNQFQKVVHRINPAKPEMTLLNVRIDSKDQHRYCASTLGNISQINTPCVFIHDALHYLSTADMALLFERNPTITDVIATTIIPPESYRRYPSLYPTLYELFYRDTTLIYIPENHHAGKYEQPISSLVWLNTNYILTEKMTLTVTLIQTKFAHHLIKISRHPGIAPRFNTFRCPDHIKIPKVYRKSLEIRNPYLPRKLVYNVLMYCKAVNKAQERDVFAKLRALIESGNPQKLELPALALLVDAALVLKANNWTYNQTPQITTSLSSAVWNKTIGFLKDITINRLYEKLYKSFLRCLEFEQLEMVFELQADSIQPYELERASSSVLYVGPPKFQQFKRKPVSQFMNSLLDKHQINQESFLRCFSWFNYLNPEVQTEQTLLPPRTLNSEHRQIKDLLDEFSQLDLDNFLTDPELKSTLDRARSEKATTSETQTDPSTMQVVLEDVLLATDDEALSIMNLPNTCGLQVFLKVRSATQIVKAYEACRGKKFLFAKTSIPSFSSARYPHEFEMMSSLEIQLLAAELGLAIRLHQYGPNHLGEKIWCCEEADNATFDIYNTGIHWTESKTAHNCQPIKSDDGLPTMVKSAEATPDTNENLSWEPLQLVGAKTIGRVPTEDDLREVYKFTDPIPLPKVDGATLSELKAFETAITEASGKKIEYVDSHPKRALIYTGSIKSGTTGCLLKDEKFQSLVLKLDKAAKMLPPRKSTIILHLGRYGSGKTTFLRDVFQAQDPDRQLIKVIVPLQDLRREWLGNSKQLRDSVQTFERAFLRPGPDILFIDEFTRLPPGYLETFLLHSPQTTRVILIGDPLQCHYHEQPAHSPLNRALSEASYYFNLYSHYLDYTFRLAPEVAAYLGVKTFSEREGRIQLRDSVIQGLPTLAPDSNAAEKLSDVDNIAFTYSGSQGQSFKTDYQIIINKYAAYASPNCLNVALSRGERNVFVILQNPYDPAVQNKINANPALKALLSHIYNVPAPLAPIPEPDVTEVQAPLTHLAIETEATMPEAIYQDSGAKENKEVFTAKYGSTNQFDDNMSHYENVFMRHQNKDQATCEITWDKRIITSTAKENAKELAVTRSTGEALFLAFSQAMNLPKEKVKFDPDLFLTKIAENEKVKLSKTLSMLTNNAGRSDPDVPPEKINLFLKSQICTKLEKINAAAKAGQSISCFQDLPIMLLGPVARYLEERVNESKPDWVHIHSRMSPQRLDSYLAKHWDFSKISNENDFTAFDQSQNGEFLNFEIMLMKHYNIPRQLIEFYVHLKVHARVFKGTLSIMRLTGEFCTFLFNTYGNIAYTHTKYRIPKGTAQVYGGDDSAINGSPELRPHWAKLASKFKLVSKEFYSYRPTFCGWYLTKFGIVKSPILLYLKLKLQEARKNLHNSLDSYFEDHRFAYLLADHLNEVLDEQELGFMQLTNRFFIEHGKDVPSKHYAE
jgi:hypothetical protein